MIENQMVIYRDRRIKKIVKYSLIRKSVEELTKIVSDFNDLKKENYAEIVSCDDLKSLIEIAEKNKYIKDHDLLEIERAIDRLQDELYNLREYVTK